MHAILRVDLQSRIGTIIIGQEFIDPRRTEALFGPGIFIIVDFDRDRRVFERQMNRLILFMIGIGQENRRRLVKCIDPVILRIVDFLTVFGLFQH